MLKLFATFFLIGSCILNATEFCDTVNLASPILSQQSVEQTKKEIKEFLEDRTLLIKKIEEDIRTCNEDMIELSLLTPKAVGYWDNSPDHEIMNYKKSNEKKPILIDYESNSSIYDREGERYNTNIIQLFLKTTNTKSTNYTNSFHSLKKK